VLTALVASGPKAIEPNLDVDGADMIFAAKVIVSDPPFADRFTVIGIVTFWPTRAAGTVPTVTDETVEAALAAGAATIIDRNPAPNAETATSAMRLRVVFVDICFLSIVDSRAFPESAWQRDKPFTL